MEKASKAQVEKRIAEMWHALNLSKYAVERHFNALPVETKEMIIQFAHILPSDLKNPHAKGYQLKDYSKQGQEKIGLFFRWIRETDRLMPAVMRLSDFHKIEELDHV